MHRAKAWTHSLVCRFNRCLVFFGQQQPHRNDYPLSNVDRSLCRSHLWHRSDLLCRNRYQRNSRSIGNLLSAWHHDRHLFDFVDEFFLQLATNCSDLRSLFHCDHRHDAFLAGNAVFYAQKKPATSGTGFGPFLAKASPSRHELAARIARTSSFAQPKLQFHTGNWGNEETRLLHAIVLCAGFDVLSTVFRSFLKLVVFPSFFPLLNFECGIFQSRHQRGHLVSRVYTEKHVQQVYERTKCQVLFFRRSDDELLFPGHHHDGRSVIFFIYFIIENV